VEWDEGRRREPSPAKDDLPADLHDFERARVGRLGFGQVCFYPGFEEAITGCYVRVNVGQNPKTGQDDYRMCLIKSTFSLLVSVCCLSNMITPRNYRGQAVRSGSGQWQKLRHDAVRAVSARQIRERFPTHCLFRRAFQRGLFSLPLSLI
jgi:hypothetical protein